jgi:alkanesulfonate monooxygenase SsuD/methylene tetrahydromethanopterin reductase-like flavin-dependent oxidoreductase (luciferase family)
MYPRGDDDMRVGLQVPSFSWPEATPSIGPKLAEISRTADEAGFARLWVMDHFFQIRGVGKVDEPMLKATAPSITWPA